MGKQSLIVVKCTAVASEIYSKLTIWNYCESIHTEIEYQTPELPDT